jgi:hypothetical protein
MSEGNAPPPKAPVVAEAHEVVSRFILGRFILSRFILSRFIPSRFIPSRFVPLQTVSVWSGGGFGLDHDRLLDLYGLENVPVE